MSTRCPSCREAFEVPAEQASRSTAVCPHCGRVVVIAGAAAPVTTGGSAEDPGTAPFLEPLSRGEGPTQIGAASQTLSLPTAKRVSVTILSGPRKGERFTLERPRLTFGRADADSHADVQVPDADVSREHAAVECYGARMVLRDLDSRHGTYLDDVRVTRREIAGGAEFRLGSTVFLLLVTDA